MKLFFILFNFSNKYKSIFIDLKMLKNILGINFKI